MKKNKTITKTFSISENIYKEFENICKKQKLNKSKIIQENIVNFIVNEFDYMNKKYIMKLDETKELISIDKIENNQLYLSDGNILNYFSFNKIYDEVDLVVQSVAEWINKSKENENPNELIDIVDTDFLKCSIDGEVFKDTLDKIDLNNVTFNDNDPYSFINKFDKKPILDFEQKNINNTKNLLLKNINFDDDFIFNCTSYFSIENFNIYIFEYELIVFYQKDLKFERTKLIKYLLDVIRDVDKVINIKLISYENKHYKINTNIYDNNYDFTDIETAEKYFMDKYGIKIILFEMINQQNENVFLIKVEPLEAIMNKDFINDIKSNLSFNIIKIDFSKYHSVQNEIFKEDL